MAIGSSAAEVFVVTNTGQSSSSPILLSLSGTDYAIVATSGDCVSGTTTLAGGGRCNIHVSLSPSTIGTLPATLTISAATGGTPPALSLTGVGKYPTGTVADFPVPVDADTALNGIAIGPDNYIWCGDSDMIHLPIPGGTATFIGAVSNGVFRVVAGPDGNMWYTNLSDPLVGRMSTTGSTNEFSFAGGTAGADVIVGPDNNIWFTEPSSNLVLRVNTSGAMLQQYTVPSAGYMAVGADGNVWVVEGGTNNKIARIVTAGTVTSFPVGTGPLGIAAGPDGNLWIMEEGAHKVGKFLVASTTLNAEYTIPTAGTIARYIAAGSDGNMWFTECDANKVGRITPAGSIMEFSPATASSCPLEITSAPDGNLYFVEQSASKIGRITP